MKRTDPIVLLENSILNNSGFSIIATNSQGIIQYFSAGAVKMLGYAAAEVIGMRSLLDLHDPNEFADAAPLEENQENFTPDRPFDILRLYAYMDAKEDMVCSYLAKEGYRVPVRMSFIRMQGPDEVLLGYIAIANDITAQKTSEESLYRVLDRLQLATLAAKMGIWDYDILQDQLIWDKTVFQLFGAGIEDGAPEWIWENRIHPADKTRVLATIHAALEREFLFEHEFRVIWPDNSVHTIKSDALVKRDAEGKPVRLIGTNRDITKQKAESEQLRLLSSVITNTNEVIIITDTEPVNGVFPCIRYVNQAFENLTGYSTEEVIGYSPRILQGPKSDKKALRRLKQAMLEWEPCEIETINYKKSGEEFWVKLSVFPVSDQNGWYTHWVSIQSDITARKQAELEREQMISELTKSNRELQQFSYIATHNLRAPLTNLIAISNLLDTTTIEDPALAEMIEGFKTSAHQLHTTLDDLIQVLLIKGDTSMDLELVEFEDIFDRVILTIQSMVQQSGAQFATDFDEATSVYFSTNYMESIFLNLISNSIKFAHPKRKPRIRIQSFKEAQTIKLIFSDNGIGFDMERVKGRIFGLHKRFHKGEGKGVGLFLIHSQITALGGTIDVESQENVGTTFTITFKQDSV
jgi:PAS domain S-box-containing protein